MEPGIIAAIITGGCAVLAAIIAGIFKLVCGKKSPSDSNVTITQIQKGTNNTQIGIQNKHGDEKDE